MDEREKELVRTLNEIIHDQVVVMQAAWIEWQHGKGAEAAMQWIEAELEGPGHIPDDSDQFHDNADMWYASNISDPFPTCWCGMPSVIAQGDKGWCCEEHRASKESIFIMPHSVPGGE